jgi:RNA polymerase sigma-70 factor (ECF subfamily)
LRSSDAPGEDLDAQLLRAHARGDPRAFADLLERYRARILHLVRCRVGAGSLWVEDVAQDVFVQVHRRAATFQGRSSVKTWLYAVAINVCRDHQRHERRDPTAGSSDIDPAEPLAQLPDSSLDPLEQLEQQERTALVRDAFEELGPAHRTVLYMRDHEDMSYEQIAGALGVPIGTVRSRIHNARALLAAALGRRMRTMRGLGQ